MPSTFTFEAIGDPTRTAALVFVVIWIILYSFNPSFVQTVDSEDIFPRAACPPDPIKCVMMSLLLTVTITVIWWGLFGDYRVVPTGESEFVD